MGGGEATVTPDDRAMLTADLSVRMCVAGMRSEVLRPAEAGGLSTSR